MEWERKQFVTFCAGKAQLLTFYCSNKPGTPNVKNRFILRAVQIACPMWIRHTQTPKSSEACAIFQMLTICLKKEKKTYVNFNLNR